MGGEPGNGAHILTCLLNTENTDLWVDLLWVVGLI